MLLIVFTLFNLQGTDTLSASQEAFGLYHTQIRLSRTLFKFFRTFSSGFFHCCLRRQLRYFSTDVSICQELFSRKSLHLLLDAIRSHEQLAYLTTPFSICQEKMRIFIPDFSNPSGEGFHLCTSGSLTGA